MIVSPAMVFACQRESYRREFITKVVSSVPVTAEKCKSEQYDIILEDTILFPEGGGQPCDHGTISGIPVIKVTRRGADAVHRTEKILSVGATVEVAVDWERRFDHMQQHTGQHLITALAEKLFSYNTTSWNLGETISFIELNTPSMPPKEMEELEEVVNEKIRSCIPVTVSMYKRDSEELKNVKTRLELPEDHAGPVRVVSIHGIDENTCCGTHVQNLSDLQMIKLLYVEKGKKNKSNLYFLSGNRVLKYLSKCVDRERILTGYLKCQPHEHPQIVEKLQKNLKINQKNALNVLRDVSILEARQFKLIDPRPRFYSYHRKEGDVEFMNIFSSEIKDDDVLLFLSVGDEKGSGQVMLTGPADLVKELGPKLCSILDGKGANKNGKFQAKVTKMAQRNKAEQFLRQAIESWKK